MALDSSGDSTAMFGSKMESGMSDEDLEDGEIASDEDEGDEPTQTKKEEPKEINKKSEPATPTTPAGKTPKSEKTPQEENDFAKDLQKLKEEFERKKESRRDPNKKRRENDRDNRDRDRDNRDRDRDRDNKNRNRKRRASDDNDKNRKEKRKKSDKGSEKDPDEEMDDDEMLGLNIRGASPTLDMETKIWSGKQPIIDPNWQFDENSENESDFDDRDDRKRRRRDKDRRNFKANSREDREIKKRVQMKRKQKNRRDDNNEMICINFMKGNCTKGNDCHYSHAVCPPKKMELCKFYLMDCCAKRDKCLYLHDEFPCKFFHTGLKCYAGNKCKFSHDPLNSLSKDILLKHLETAPKEILGDFPRLSRDCAETMVNNKTTGKPNDTAKIPSLFDIQVSIPAGFQGSDKNDERTTPPCSPPPNVKMSPKTKPKFYQEQDSNDNDNDNDNEENDRNDDAEGGPDDFAKELEAYKNIKMQNKGSESSQKSSDDKNQGFNAMAYFSNSVSGNQPPCIKSDSRSEDEEKPHRRHKKHKDETNETEFDEKDEKRRRRKHEDKHRSKRKEDKSDDEHKKSRRERRSSKKETPERSGNTPVRLAEDGSFGGIKFKISTRKEIRKSSDSDKERDLLLPSKIEKPNEFLSSDDEKPLNYLVRKKDDRKREVEEDQYKGYEEEEKFGVEVKQDVEDETDECENENQLVIETNDEPEEEEKPEREAPTFLPKMQRTLFARIQAQQHQKSSEDEDKYWKEDSSRERKTSITSGNESDAEVGKTPSPEPADENWYSSDDDDGGTKESPLNVVLKNLNTEKKSVFQNTQLDGNRSHTPPPKPKIEITALNDLSKINITELLSSIRQVTSKSSHNSTSDKSKFSDSNMATSYEPPKIENPIKMNFFNSEPEKKDVNKDPRLRDPRTHSEGKITATRRASEEKPYGKSIYDSANFKIDIQDSDLRLQAKSDSDERVPRLDAVVPFGDVDLRTLNPGAGGTYGKDFDMRKFGLPFKPVPVHTAATEIDASLASHPPISYKLDSIDIPAPDFSALKIGPADPIVKRDPRLRRLFRINSSDADPKEEQKKSGLPTDPRQRKNVPVADTPKSPTESPFSPKQGDQQPILGNNQNLLSANLLLLAQLGLSAAAGGATVFDPRLQQLLSKNPQEFEMLRNQLANIKSQADFDMFRNQLLNCENPDMMRPVQGGLLPTPMPPGMGLLGPAPNFMMPGMGMPDPSIMMGQMGPMGQNPMGQNPMGFDPRFGGNQGNNNAGNDEDMDNNEVRHFNRGFRNDRRGRGNWRGNRDRNWDRDNRRHKRDDRDRNRHNNRDRDDRRERKRSSTPD